MLVIGMRHVAGHDLLLDSSSLTGVTGAVDDQDPRCRGVGNMARSRIAIDFSPSRQMLRSKLERSTE